MDVYRITGGKKLQGEVTISGSKNAALPIIVASLLIEGKTVLKNVPNLMDIRTIIKVIDCIGAKTEFNIETNTLTIQVNSLKNAELPYELVKTMRASVYVLGPLLARCGEAEVSLPGGCAIGPRPVDIHLEGFKAMGAEIDIDHGNIKARADKLKGAKYIMKKVSVGATANLIMGAVLAEGETLLENCAMEPDIVDLGHFLNNAGAKIEGLGTESISIQGVSKLSPVTHSIMPDRIEAGTFLLASAITRGSVTLHKINPTHVGALLTSLSEMGYDIESGPDWASIKSSRDPKGVMVKTCPYPGFPTDLQAPIMSLMTTVPGISVVIETIFENRFTHVAELRRMGAHITTENHVAIIEGGEHLSSATVMMSDLRAGAALVLAALATDGPTEIRRIYHSDRGYEKLSEKLLGLGADIVREEGGKS